MTPPAARSLHPFMYIGPNRVYTVRDRRFLLAGPTTAHNARIDVRRLRELPHSNRRSHGVLMRLHKRALR
jgi:hypothetical protein